MTESESIAVLVVAYGVIVVGIYYISSAMGNIIALAILWLCDRYF